MDEKAFNRRSTNVEYQTEPASMASKVNNYVTGGFNWDQFKDDLAHPFDTANDRYMRRNYPNRDADMEKSQLAKDLGGDAIAKFAFR